MPSELVSFRTDDGVEIVGDWYAASGDRFALLLHMRPATKERWKTFAEALVARGVSCLAIDQRGHGESTMGGALNYRNFGNEEAAGKRLDVEAAFAFLKSKGATEAATIIVGASIGANLGIRFLLEHPDAPLCVALSPGVDFRGVTTDDAIVRLGANQRVILVASDDDPHGAFESARRLHALAQDRTVLIERSGLGHGTDMLDRDASLLPELISML